MVAAHCRDMTEGTEKRATTTTTTTVAAARKESEGIQRALMPLLTVFFLARSLVAEVSAACEMRKSASASALVCCVDSASYLKRDKGLLQVERRYSPNHGSEDHSGRLS